MNKPSDRDVQAWARRELHVGLGATPAEVRQAALRVVGAARAMPTLDDAIAIGVALGRSRENVETFMHEAYFSRDEDGLARAIEEFGREFFKIPRPERVTRWTELRGRASAFPWWRSRIDHFEKGLDIEPPSETSHPLADIAFELFLLPPTERAARRREFVASVRATKTTNEDIAAFRQTHPEIANLASDLFDDLRSSNAAPKRVATVAKTGGTYSPRTPTLSPRPQSSNRGWPVFAIVMVGVILIRVVIGLNTPSIQRPLAPRFDVQPKIPDREKIRADNEKNKIDEIDEAIRRLKQKPEPK